MSTAPLRILLVLCFALLTVAANAQGCACGGGCGGEGTGCGCQYNGACGMNFNDNKAVIADGWSGSQLLPGNDGKILGFPAKNVGLYAWMPINTLDTSSTRANDVWGYTSPSGREYAIIGLERGTAFVEVTQPTQPKLIGVIPGPAAIWRDMKTYKQWCYSVNDGSEGPGLQTYDLSHIDDSTVTLLNVFIQDGLRTTHNLAINPVSGYLYLSGSNIRGRGLMAMNVQFGVPFFAGAWPDHYVHDAVIHSYTSGPFAGRELAFASTTEQGMKVLDVTDKTSITVVSSGVYPNVTYCHHGWLDDQQRYYYVNDELDELQKASLVPSTTSYVFDVSDPANPAYIGGFSNGSKAIDHNPLGRGRFLFEANYRSGLRIWEVADPLHARESGYFDTWPEDDNTEFNGAWGVYCLFASGTVVVSDIERGLFVLNTRPATRPNASQHWDLYQ